MTNSWRSKLFMLLVSISGVFVGVVAGVWFFDQFS